MLTIFIILSVVFAMISLALFISLRSERKGALRLLGDVERAREESLMRDRKIEEEVQCREQLQQSMQQQVTEAQMDAHSLRIQLTAADRRYEELNERSKQQHREQGEQQQRQEAQLREQFRNLATDILKEQSEEFKMRNKESINTLLTPFKQDITSFRDRVETIYNFENEQRGALKNELERLMELNRRITTETSNLTSALRGNSKVQGDWGEMILETILESSNLVKGSQYFTQSSFNDEAGNRLRPDVVLNLPEGKQIIIDSKTSLTAFVNYVNCENADERRQHLEAHIVSVRQHIKELSRKEYQKLVKSPDFVIMFIPSEPAFLAALQSDSSLWSEAYEKKVIISSPTNLFALLKLVDDLWKRNAQSKNTAEIVTRGTKLYDQLVNFVTQFEGVGVALESAQTKYSDAYKRLTSGNDNIIRNGEKLRILGLPTKRKQSAKALINNDIEEDGLFAQQDQNTISSNDESGE